MIARDDENKRSPLKAWVRALERTATIGRERTLTLPVLIGRLAERFGEAPALLTTDTSWSYRALAAACNRYARWGLSRGLTPGDTVCLMMTSCSEYLAIWLGLTRIGVTVALINTNLRGSVLAHSLQVVSPRAVIAGASLAAAVSELPDALAPAVECWTHGAHGTAAPRLDEEVASLSGDPLKPTESPLPTLADRALCIYTSGTTGLPKAANISHFRLLQWSHWFAGLMDVQPADRMYNCLPLYHSVGGVVATGATLVGGGAVVLRERFSASAFWKDMVAERCTLFQYIGELCRYLLNSPSQEDESRHVLRLACGNGLRGDVWKSFQERFRIPQVLEYYAATEGNFSLYNVEGRVGAIGRIPPFLAHRLAVALVQFDVAAQEPLRDASGRCVRCAPGEVGEALGQIVASNELTRFEGYTEGAASAKKILRDVFAAGDAWYRTGDLMRQDAHGFFYFIDRVGDTFRWKGENVSTTEVEAILTGLPGIREAAVYGVTMPGAEGRAGMAALVVTPDFDLAALRRALAERLPEYARPVFLRIVSSFELTGTFKLRKQDLAAEGYDPARVRDALYVSDATHDAYLTLDAARHAQLAAGTLRL